MIQVFAYGRLGKDPVQKTTSNGKAMTVVNLAADATPWNSEEQETVWLSVLCFGAQADAMAKHNKGDLVAIQGKLTQSRWTTNGGEERTGFSVIADAVVSARTVRPAGGRKSGQAQGRKQAAAEDFYDDAVPFS